MGSHHFQDSIANREFRPHMPSLSIALVTECGYEGRRCTQVLVQGRFAGLVERYPKRTAFNRSQPETWRLVDRSSRAVLFRTVRIERKRSIRPIVSHLANTILKAGVQNLVRRVQGNPIKTEYVKRLFRYRLTGMLNTRPPITSPTLKSFLGLRGCPL
jgi:hypothetical protein